MMGPFDSAVELDRVVDDDGLSAQRGGMGKVMNVDRPNRHRSLPWHSGLLSNSTTCVRYASIHGRVLHPRRCIEPSSHVALAQLRPTNGTLRCSLCVVGP
jgi:hypothetical protein